ALDEGEKVKTGALLTLQTKSGICDDYAKLFVALARAAGIPSRYVTLYVQREKVEPHASAEIYLPPYGWIPLDPTWGVKSPSFAIQAPLLPVRCKEATVPDCNYDYILEGINIEEVNVSLSMEISDLDMKNSDDWLFFFDEPFYEYIYELISTKGINENLEFFQAYNTELGYQALNLSTSSPKADSVFLISKAIKAQQENNYLSVQPEIEESLVKNIIGATENWPSLLEQFKHYLWQEYSYYFKDPDFILFDRTTTYGTGEIENKNILLKDVLSNLDLAINKSNTVNYYLDQNNSHTAYMQLEGSYNAIFGVTSSLISDIVRNYIQSNLAVKSLFRWNSSSIGFIAFLFIFMALAPLFWVWMWIHCLTRKEFLHLKKIWWFLIVFFGYIFIPLGAILYFILEFRKRSKAEG
ncbi:MAG: transglutaminase-like domain-containing protein, partial [Nanoarchaeota archaeon]